jgi:4-hydroxy-2-oxoheptanedioate aldolase
MERGVLGVQVPHVNTAAEAKQAVEAVIYFPLGQRGLAAGSRPATYGLQISAADYTSQANRETLVCIQLEEKQALENLDELLQVEGVDVFFLGPSDLSQSLGVPGQTQAPVVRNAMADAFRRIGLAGKIAGSAGTPEAIHHYRQQDVHYLYTHLSTLLARASTAFFASNPREE